MRHALLTRLLLLVTRGRYRHKQLEKIEQRHAQSAKERAARGVEEAGSEEGGGSSVDAAQRDVDEHAAGMRASARTSARRRANTPAPASLESVARARAPHSSVGAEPASAVDTGVSPAAADEAALEEAAAAELEGYDLEKVAEFAVEEEDAETAAEAEAAEAYAASAHTRPTLAHLTHLCTLLLIVACASHLCSTGTASTQ